MTSRERLEATLTGKPVDRVPVNFYEIGGFEVDPSDPDPFNVYSGPTWKPLIDLAENRSDLIRMREFRTRPVAGNRWGEFFSRETYMEDGSRYTRTTLRAGNRTMTELTRRDPDVDTVWVVEHLLKDVDDLKAYLSLPDEALAEEADVSHLAGEDAKVGDRGIVMMNVGDPICMAAALFDMSTYMLIAYSEPVLFHALLEKLARHIQPQTERAAEMYPGHLWRVFGPEYAAEPYLPPHLFEEYVVRYTEPMVRAIQRYGGWVRLHCHGHIRNILPHILGMGVDAIDPIEPEPQGDVDLAFVRREYGKDIALFGNLEISDIETMEPREFEKVVARALDEGTRGEGRGFCLMPSAAPYGREISPTTLANYETMIRLACG